MVQHPKTVVLREDKGGNLFRNVDAPVRNQKHEKETVDADGLRNDWNKAGVPQSDYQVRKNWQRRMQGGETEVRCNRLDIQYLHTASIGRRISFALH